MLYSFRSENVDAFVALTSMPKRMARESVPKRSRSYGGFAGAGPQDRHVCAGAAGGGASGRRPRPLTSAGAKRRRTCGAVVQPERSGGCGRLEVYRNCAAGGRGRKA